MFFKANQKLPSQEEWVKRTNELGIDWNGTTSGERVNYFITLSSNKLNEGLEFMNSSIRYPLFLKQEMINENPVVDGEFQRAESNPIFFLRMDGDRYLWGDNYSRKNTIGDHDIILTATPEKMKIIQEKYYYPNNSIVVVAGNVDHKEVLKKVNTIFGDWKPSDFDPFEKYPIPKIEPLEKSIYYITENENTRTPIIRVALHGPSTKNDLTATYAADIFSTILAQKSSKLQKDLVDSGLAYQVGVSYYTQMHVGPINIFIVPNPEKIKEAMSKLEEHIALWNSDDYYTDEQLETAKTLMAIDDAYGKEQTSQFLHTVTFWWASATIGYYTSYVENMNKVTRKDIKNYIETYIQGKPQVVGLLLSPAMKEQMQIESFEALLSK